MKRNEGLFIDIQVDNDSSGRGQQVQAPVAYGGENSEELFIEIPVDSSGSDRGQQVQAPAACGSENSEELFIEIPVDSSGSDRGQQVQTHAEHGRDSSEALCINVPVDDSSAGRGHQVPYRASSEAADEIKLSTIDEIKQMLCEGESKKRNETVEQTAAPACSCRPAKVYDPAEAADDLFHSLWSEGQWQVAGDILWFCNRKDRIWRTIMSPEEMSKAVNQIGYVCLGEKAKLLRARFISESGITKSRFQLCQKPNWISFKDSLFDLLTGEIRGRTERDFVGYMLSITHESAMTPTRMQDFKDLVSKAAGSNEARDRLQEFMGCAISAAPSGGILYVQSQSMRIASAFVSLLDNAVEPEFVRHLSLKDFQRNFSTAQVVGKHLILSSKEGEALIQDLDTILRIADGDGVNADRKFQDAIDFKANATFVCAGKRLPRLRFSQISDVSEFIDRVILTGSLSAYELRELKSMHVEFVSWAIDGLRRYLSQGGFTSQPGAELCADTESVDLFVSQYIVLDANSSCSSRKLLSSYKAMCAELGYAPCEDRAVHQAVQKLLGRKTSSVREIDPNGKSVVCSGYRGLRLQEPNEETVNENKAPEVDAVITYSAVEQEYASGFDECYHSGRNSILADIGLHEDQDDFDCDDKSLYEEQDDDGYDDWYEDEDSSPDFVCTGLID